MVAALVLEVTMAQPPQITLLVELVGDQEALEKALLGLAQEGLAACHLAPILEVMAQLLLHKECLI
jgi:hypothetical protein